MVSSWFSCSLIDQQHGAQWAESKWELNRQHQGFVALCSLPAWGSKFSHHREGWSPWRLQIALCFTPVSWMCFSFGLIYFFFFHLPLSVHVFSHCLSSPQLCSSPRQLHADESSGIFFPGVSWKVGCSGTDYLSQCVFVCVHRLSWTLPEQLRSALFLCAGHLMVWRRARGGAVYICSSAV